MRILKNTVLVLEVVSSLQTKHGSHNEYLAQTCMNRFDCKYLAYPIPSNSSPAATTLVGSGGGLLLAAGATNLSQNGPKSTKNHQKLIKFCHSVLRFSKHVMTVVPHAECVEGSWPPEHLSVPLRFTASCIKNEHFSGTKVYPRMMPIVSKVEKSCSLGKP